MPGGCQHWVEGWTMATRKDHFVEQETKKENSTASVLR